MSALPCDRSCKSYLVQEALFNDLGSLFHLVQLARV
jgi:hypothetical protein